MNLGGGVKVVNVSYQMVVQNQEHEAAHTTPEPEDTRPIAIKSGDKEVDVQSELDGFQLKSQEEIDQLSGEHTPDQPQNSFDQMMENDGSSTFQTTNDSAVNQHYRDRGETSVPQSLGTSNQSQQTNNDTSSKAGYDRPQMSQSDYARAFRQASERTNEVYKSKGPDIE
ncbi:hypothetical protein D1821_06075 [Phaeobacter inhibens]|nr:hypothetical protein BWR17_15230 [Phaeobacter inhibens]AXT41988.1 hypothetical protein D1821_06075 [Phaeobacter inhibens]